MKITVDTTDLVHYRLWVGPDWDGGRVPFTIAPDPEVARKVWLLPSEVLALRDHLSDLLVLLGRPVESRQLKLEEW